MSTRVLLLLRISVLTSVAAVAAPACNKDSTLYTNTMDPESSWECLLSNGYTQARRNKNMRWYNPRTETHSWEDPEHLSPWEEHLDEHRECQCWC